MKVSVIIPIYGVEKFIARCAESLFSQTLHEEVEFIFVDDASTDGSMDILHETMERFPRRKGQIRIITNESNKGLPAARNTGLAVATGEYVFHCDSDDFVEPDMLETLYDAAKEADADIIWCDWFLSFAKSERYMKQPVYRTPLEAVKAMLGGAMKFNVWNKLVRRSLYAEHDIVFPAGYGMGEDMTMIMLFACAQRIAYLPQAFYHYVKTNNGAFSQTYSERHLYELRHNVSCIEDFLTRKYKDGLEQEIAYMKLEAKFPFLLSGDKARLRLWSQWYPEANRYILSNKNISARSRFLQWCAWKGQLWLVEAYSFLLRKVVYGIIYR